MKDKIYQVYYEQLKNNEYKQTPQRKIILDILLENMDKHLSPEELHDLVKIKHTDIGLATVYRTLQLFDELGIVHKLNFGDGCARYELNRYQSHHHHHVICLKCGEVLEFGDDHLEKLEKNISKELNFKIIDHRVKFLGYCSKCQETMNN